MFGAPQTRHVCPPCKLSRARRMASDSASSLNSATIRVLDLDDTDDIGACSFIEIIIFVVHATEMEEVERQVVHKSRSLYKQPEEPFTSEDTQVSPELIISPP
jgi:hypothetical protein